MNYVPSSPRIGVFGGGQLGQMFAERAFHFGFPVSGYVSEDKSPLARMGFPCTKGSLEDTKAIQSFLESIDILTFEFENVPTIALDFFEEWQMRGNLLVRPSTKAIRIAQDRILEKSYFQKLGLPSPSFCAFQPPDFPDPVPFAFPWVIKTVRGGYDGKGQTRIQTQQDWLLFQERTRESKDSSFLIESFVPFQGEISVILGRFANGKVSVFPAVENRHKKHILDISITPSSFSAKVNQEAMECAIHLAHSLDYVGVLGMEFFVLEDSVLCNEFAPRPHNSGHFSQDAGNFSQFDLQLFTLLDLFDKIPERISTQPTIMKNIIGQDYNKFVPKIRELAYDSRYKLHLYGKEEVRDGRKLGHINFKGTLSELDPFFLD